MTAAAAVDVGVASDVADAFLQPNGILMRMRALAQGWTNPGDKVRAPTDVGWWKARYRFPLWGPLGTYVDSIRPTLEAHGVEPGMVFNEDVARGDSVALSRMVASLSQEIDFLTCGDRVDGVCEAPCPKWLIPPSDTRGLMPVPNPDCARREREEAERRKRKKRDDKQEQKKQDAIDWLVVLGVLGLAYLAGKKALS